MPEFLFLGDSLCLDLVNTRVLVGGESTELLVDASQAARWCREAKARGVLPEHFAPVHDEDGFRRLVALREAVHGGVERLTAGKRVAPSTLEAVNGALRAGAGHVELAFAGDRIERRFRFHDGTDAVYAVAESAAALFAEADPALIKVCAAPDCVLVFHDVTKNHARRWCDMAVCGNRAKAAAHYDKVKRRSRKPAS